MLSTAKRYNPGITQFAHFSQHPSSEICVIDHAIYGQLKSTNNVQQTPAIPPTIDMIGSPPANVSEIQ